VDVTMKNETKVPVKNIKSGIGGDGPHVKIGYTADGKTFIPYPTAVTNEISLKTLFGNDIDPNEIQTANDYMGYSINNPPPQNATGILAILVSNTPELRDSNNTAYIPITKPNLSAATPTLAQKLEIASESADLIIDSILFNAKGSPTFVIKNIGKIAADLGSSNETYVQVDFEWRNAQGERSAENSTGGFNIGLNRKGQPIPPKGTLTFHSQAFLRVTPPPSGQKLMYLTL